MTTKSLQTSWPSHSGVSWTIGSKQIQHLVVQPSALQFARPSATKFTLLSERKMTTLLDQPTSQQSAGPSATKFTLCRWYMGAGRVCGAVSVFYFVGATGRFQLSGMSATSPRHENRDLARWFSRVWGHSLRSQSLDTQQDSSKSSLCPGMPKPKALVWTFQH